MDKYVNKPIIVEAERYDGIIIKGFREYRGGPWHYAIFDNHIKHGGMLIVAIGEWVVYMPDGEIKSYTDREFKLLFQKVIT